LFLLLALSASITWANVYNTDRPSALAPGQTQQVWSAEQPAPGNGTTAASQQVGMANQPGVAGTPFRVHGFFSAAPGVFEVDVQVSEDDVDTHYQTISGGNITSVDAVNFTFHLDCLACSTRYARLLMRSRTNAVNVTGYIGR
jgi:hypothetical protein